jgi:hypothetical protein
VTTKLADLQKTLSTVIGLKDDKDVEVAHMKADDCLIATIRILARGTHHKEITEKIVDAFLDEDFTKWYA